MDQSQVWLQLGWTGDFGVGMKFKVGDLVRHTRQWRAKILRREGLAIVVEIPTGDYAQLKVATVHGITYWWPAVTELADESR
jgi:hypothetical protein